MRLATQSNEIIRNDYGWIIGLSLGFDFCAEHEWGYRWAERGLGRPATISRELLGIPARTTRKFEMHVEHFIDKNREWLFVTPFHGDNYEQQVKGPRNKQCRNVSDMESSVIWYEKQLAGKAESRSRGSWEFVSAWSGDGGFAICALTDDAKEALNVIKTALLDKECFINQATAVFGGGGLCLLDSRLIDEKHYKEMEKGDISHLNLTDAVAANGILARLDAAGKGRYKGYYACSPRWDDEEKGTFKFWLNPYDQQNNNYGWYTTEQLDQWIAGKGPIPMTKEQKLAKQRY